jgi:hypothetical protein
MTAEERLEDMELWLAAEYERTYSIWRHAVRAGDDPQAAAWTFIKMQTLEQVARHLLIDDWDRQDLPRYVLHERWDVFKRHLHNKGCPWLTGEGACICGRGDR